MSYGGSVLAMIISLKNNALQRKKPFENLKDNPIHHQSKIAKPRIRRISPIKLAKIKSRIQAESAREKRKQTILITILILFFVSIMAYITLAVLG
jgi:hypothetical protein